MIVVGIALITGISVWFMTGCNRDDKGVAVTTGTLSDARILTDEELATLPDQAGHEVFWAGEREGTELEFSDDPSGNVHLRYLTDGNEAGTEAQTFLDIGTYPFAGAYETTKQLSQQKSLTKVPVSGGVGFYDKDRPYSVILAFSSEPDLQVEVYHPEKNGALEVVRGGDIVPVP
jgi:hypothetical protein